MHEIGKIAQGFCLSTSKSTAVTTVKAVKRCCDGVKWVSKLGKFQFSELWYPKILKQVQLP